MGSGTEGWLSVREFAAVAGISERKGRQALVNAAEAGSHWRGQYLTVRERHGAGGRSGVRYEVAVSSLPADLRDRLKGLQKPLQGELKLHAPAPGADEQSRWWSHHLTPLLGLPEGSSERAEAVTRLSEQVLLDWKNRPVRYARETIYKRLKELDRYGLAALPRQRRADAGKARTIISRRWDAAVPFDLATKAKIAEGVPQEIRERRADRTSRKWVLALAQNWLMRETASHGFRLPSEKAFKALCAVPMSFYAAEAQYEVVYYITRDRDRFDNNLPRIKRTYAGLRPMELVVADVHPKDLLIRRSDGSIGPTRLLAFMDMATRRVRAEIVMIEGRGGVRNVDGIKAFVAMAMDHAWGLPENFYIDNGSEYLFANYLGDAISLAGRGGGRIIRATPYNAAAKPIEAWFHRFEVDHMRPVPGWHGGKLGAPKRPARGKLPKPFEGGFDALCAIVQGHINAYNSMHQPYGELGQDSPYDRFASFVEKGWAATIIDPQALLTVFTESETRIVKQHGISVAGRSWSCPEMREFFGRTVTVKVPALGLGFNELWVGDEHGVFIGIARPDVEAAPLDTRLALHSADRKKESVTATRRLQKRVKDRTETDTQITQRGRATDLQINPPRETCQSPVRAPPHHSSRSRPLLCPRRIRTTGRRARRKWLPSMSFSTGGPPMLIKPTEAKHFVELSSTAAVGSAVATALQLDYPSLILGEAGTGKTTALLHHAAEHNAVYCHASSSAKTVRGMFQLLLNSGEWYSKSTFTRDLEDTAYSRFNSWGQARGRMVIVDEVQNLGLEALRELLNLQETCRLPMVLAGNDARLARTRSHDTALEQITSRIGFRVRLPRPSAEDCRKLAEAFGVSHPAALSALSAFG